MTEEEYKAELAKVEAQIADPTTPQELLETLIRARHHLMRRAGS
jgi:hypothetical protein